MSVLIKGMDMPKKEMILILFPDGKIATKEYEIGAKAKAVEVPTPHGRLIDADALVHSYYHAPSFSNLCKAINTAPTIIPAEEGET